MNLRCVVMIGGLTAMAGGVAAQSPDAEQELLTVQEERFAAAIDQDLPVLERMVAEDVRSCGP